MTVALMMLACGAEAEAKPAPPRGDPAKRAVISAEETKRLGDAERRRAEAQEPLWDRKMKAWSTDVCTGC